MRHGKRMISVLILGSILLGMAPVSAFAATENTTKEEVVPAIERAISLNKPVVLNCMIPEDDKVFPMVPAGAPISEAFDAEDLKNKEA